jgi:hypothetical protein
VTAADGVLQMTKAPVSSGDATALTGNWEVEGDFELRVDYLIAAAPSGGRAFAVGYGPMVMGTYVPTMVSQVYAQQAGYRAALVVGDAAHDIGGAANAGTLRIRRTGAESCVEVVGVDTNCRTVTAPRLHLYLEASEVDASCVLCGALDVRFSNARLVSGRLVAP